MKGFDCPVKHHLSSEMAFFLKNLVFDEFFVGVGMLCDWIKTVTNCFTFSATNLFQIALLA
jgi:hypothetical protein